jgi:hypothetical protein
MNAKNLSVLSLGLLLVAQHSLAVQPLSVVVGTPLPLGMGGIAVIAGVGLIIGAQLIKRNKK